jgi:hypothetical protein
LENNTGFFPATSENIIKFSDLMIKAIQNVDILGVMLRPDEMRFKDDLKKSIKIDLIDIEPYCHADPWSKILAHKNVLVIHPFSKTIKSQYEKSGDKLFKDKQVLPEFNLKTLTAVQSIAHTSTSYKDWFEALYDMQEKIAKIEFDVAIIGCGAYGFPLASFIKDQGKQAIHMGGATQILFGIKGQRWDSREFYASLYNEYWVRPSEDETPKNFQNVEAGCYW